VLASSGDDGVAGNKARGSVGLCDYQPQWPASSPYITTVGATQGPENHTAEVACSAGTGAFITTGGGFAKAFDTPAWQRADVAGFLAQSAPSSFGPGFNAKGRAYPDVSLLGHNYPVFEGGVGYLLDGTSASTPVFAAMVSLVNAARLAAGKSSVGFANPALYALAKSAPQAFSDITAGANNCAAGGWDGPANCCSSQGFYATPGWDPVTGLGSVHLDALIKAWVALGPGPAPAPPTPSTPTPAPGVPTPPPAPTPAAPTPAPGLNCKETSAQKGPCGMKVITTEDECKAAFGGGKCCWAEVGTDIWCYQPLPSAAAASELSVFPGA
jgi:hypothetical protein